MNNLKKNSFNLSTLLIVVFFVALFLYILYINLHTPLMSDDLVFSNATAEKLNAWGLINRDIRDTYSSYFSWGGRIFTDLIEYSGIIGTHYLDIVNAIIFCLLIYAVFLCTNLKRPKSYSDLSILILLTASIWFILNQLAEVSFWKIGSSYLWTLTGNLFIIYPFLRLFGNQDIISGRLFKTIILILASLILSAGLEHLSVATCLLLVFITGYSYWKNKKVPIWAILSTLAYLIGTTLLLTAPGNFIRYTYEASAPASHTSLVSLLIKIYPMSIAIIHHYIANLGFPLLFIVALCIFLFPLHRSIKTIQVAILMFFMVGLTAFALMGAPGIRFANRGAFFSDIFFIIATFSVISQANQFTNWRRLLNTAGIFVFIFLVYAMVKNYQDMASFHRQVREREQLISFYLQKNVPMAYIPAIYFDRLHASTYPTHSFYTRHIDYDDIFPNQPNHWVNQAFAKYYHLNQVQLTPFVELLANLNNYTLLGKTEGGFSIYLEKNKLLFVNRNHACSEIKHPDNRFIRVYPKNRFNLLPKEMIHGFYDINFKDYKNNLVTVINADGKVENGLCVLAVYLPSYPIHRIEIGQYGQVTDKNKTIYQESNS